MFPQGEVFVYDFSTNKIKGEKGEAYWRDVGTIESYWSAHMDLLQKMRHFLFITAVGLYILIIHRCHQRPLLMKERKGLYYR